MIQTITGLFDSMEDAQGAAKELMDRDIPRDQISLVARSSDGEGAQQHAVGESAAPEGAGAGAMGGTVLGGALGLLVGAGLLIIPGIGPVLAVGPLAAAIGSAAAAVGATALGAGVGAGVGGLAGGLVGGLIGAGVPEEHAHAYAEGVMRGGTLLTARVDSDRAGQVDDVMRRYGVADIERRGAEWRIDEDWQSHEHDPSTRSDPDPAAPRVLRDHREEGAGEAWQDSSKMGTTAGALSGVATGAVIGSVAGPVGTVIGGAAGAALGAGVGVAGDVAGERAIPADEYRGVGEDNQDQDTLAPHEYASPHRVSGSFEHHEADFKAHYMITWPDRATYAEYVPAYRFGYDMASDPRYPNGSWEVIEPDLRRDWEERHTGAWDEFGSAIRFAWEQARGLR